MSDRADISACDNGDDREPVYVPGIWHALAMQYIFKQYSMYDRSTFADALPFRRDEEP